MIFSIISVAFDLIPKCLLHFFMSEKLKEKVEEFFACEYELCIEFTGLVRSPLIICSLIYFNCFCHNSNLFLLILLLWSMNTT